MVSGGFGIEWILELSGIWAAARFIYTLPSDKLPFEVSAFGIETR